MNQHSTGQIHVMNLRILHYSFINHQFHHSTITIKQKNHHKQTCNIATLRSFSVKKIVVRMKNVKFRGKKKKFRGPRKLWALVIRSVSSDELACVMGNMSGHGSMYSTERSYDLCTTDRGKIHTHTRAHTQRRH